MLIQHARPLAVLFVTAVVACASSGGSSSDATADNTDSNEIADAETSSEPEAAAEEEKKAEVDPNMVRARSHLQSFYDGSHSDLMGRFSPDLRSQFGGGALYELKDQLDQYGGETEVLEETMKAEDTGLHYIRRAKFGTEVILKITLTYDNSGHIVGFLIEPETEEQ